MESTLHCEVYVVIMPQGSDFEFFFFLAGRYVPGLQQFCSERQLQMECNVQRWQELGY